MYGDRKELYRKLEVNLDTRILTYVTGDRQGFETEIAQDVIDIFVEHLDKIGVVKSLTLYLYTRGGNISAAWNIVNLLHLYCDELHVIVPHKAHSAGTLISIGAKSIIMTKQATLSPIDPSVNTLLNPPIPTQPGRTMPVSVEAVEGYLAYAKEKLELRDDIALSNILLKLSDMVHPLALGEVYRSRAQIKMLAQKLLSNQVSDVSKKANAIAFLCSDSGSHDYTINRREAEDSLGLNVRNPDDKQYSLIKGLYDNISAELELGQFFDQKAIIVAGGDYCLKRAFIESIDSGCHSFVSRGKITRPNISTSMVNGQPSQEIIRDERLKEGWEKI